MGKLSDKTVYEFGEFRLDACHRMLYRGKTEIPLAPKAVETLLALIERSGEVVGKQELIERLWPDAIVEESNLFLYISVLRKTLGRQANGEPWLATLRRRGYRFNGEIRVVGTSGGAHNARKLDTTQAGESRALRHGRRITDRPVPPVAGPSTRAGSKMVRYAFTAPVLAVLMIGVFAAAFYWDRKPESPSADAETKDIEAWEHYRKGTFYLSRFTAPEIRTGIEHFQKAIERDPRYTRAYTALAWAFISLPLTSDYAPADCFPRAEAAAKTAIKLDDQLAEGHAVMAAIQFWYGWDWERSEAECRSAMQLGPSSPDVHYTCAHLYSNLGRHTEALAGIRRARALDPGNLRNDVLEGEFMLNAGQTEQAFERLRQLVERQPKTWLGHLLLSSIYIEKEMYDEAIAAADLARDNSAASNHPAALKAYALAKAGRRSEAIAILDDLTQQANDHFVPPYYFALIYNGLGETDKALAWLERGFEQRDSKMVFLKVEPKWNNMRSDQRFIALLGRMNLQ